MLLTVLRRWSRCFCFVFFFLFVCMCVCVCVALWFILRGASCFKVFPCSLSTCFVILFSTVFTSLGEEVGWLCWGLTSQSTIFQSCRDGAIASWVINQYFRGVKCLAQGHNTAEIGLEPRTSRSGVRHSTTEPPRSPLGKRELVCVLLVHLFVCFIRVSFVIFLFLLVSGLAAVCECGTPWTFLLTFFFFFFFFLEFVLTWLFSKLMSVII